MDYRSPSGKQVVPFANVMSKLGISREQAEEEAERLGLTIPEEQFELRAARRGRPKKSVATTDTDSEVETPTKKRGRPKKIKKVVTASAPGDDLIALLVSEANAHTDLSSSSDDSVSDVDDTHLAENEATENEATEKEATEKEATEKEATEKEATEKEATKALKAALKAEAKAKAKAEAKAVKEALKVEKALKATEKAAEKEALKVEKAAEKEALKVEKAAEKEALKVEKAALKVKKEALKVKKAVLKAEEKALRAVAKKAVAVEKEGQVAVAKAKKEEDKLAESLAIELVKENTDGHSVSGEDETKEMQIDPAEEMLTLELENPATDDDEDSTNVKEFKHAGKIMWRDGDGILYNPETEEPIGKWNSKTLTVDELPAGFDNDSDDDDC